MMLRKVSRGIYETATRSFRIEYVAGSWTLVRAADGVLVTHFRTLAAARSYLGGYGAPSFETSPGYERSEDAQPTQPADPLPPIALDWSEALQGEADEIATEALESAMRSTVLGCVDCGAMDVELLSDWRCEKCVAHLSGPRCAQDHLLAGHETCAACGALHHGSAGCPATINAINRALISGALGVTTSGLVFDDEPARAPAPAQQTSATRTTTLEASATYSRLRDGTWGVRVNGARPTIDTVVLVTKRAGGVNQETISRVIWSDPAGRFHVCSIVPTPYRRRRA